MNVIIAKVGITFFVERNILCAKISKYVEAVTIIFQMLAVASFCILFIYEIKTSDPERRIIECIHR